MAGRHGVGGEEAARQVAAESQGRQAAQARVAFRLAGVIPRRQRMGRRALGGW